MSTSVERSMEAFKQFFREDLMRSLEMKTIPAYKAVVAGGYGMKSVLETKYKLMDAIHTSDFDVTISSSGCMQSSLKSLQYFAKRVMEFIDAQPVPTDYKLMIVHQGNQVVPTLGHHRFAVLMLKYKHRDFVDIAFTDVDFPSSMYDRPTSRKLGFPVKKLSGYLQDLLTMLYFENVPGVYPEVYNRRNPVEGWEHDKGEKDFERTGVVCKVLDSKKYSKYCKLVKNTKVSELKGMDDQQKKKYFSSLETLLKLRAKQHRGDKP